jgi:hypothetical protein
MNQQKQPQRCNLVTEFIIPKFIEGSTCFERHTVHHQELQTVFAASGLYTHVLTSRCREWEFPPSLDNDQSPHVYINQKLKIQFEAPDDELYAAQNMLSFQ